MCTHVNRGKPGSICTKIQHWLSLELKMIFFHSVVSQETIRIRGFSLGLAGKAITWQQYKEGEAGQMDRNVWVLI